MVVQVFAIGLTREQGKALSQRGIDLKKFDRKLHPMGSVLVGPKFDGQDLGSEYIPVRLYESDEKDRGKYLHEVNLGGMIWALFKCPLYLLNQQRAREYPLNLEEAEDILHWGDHDSKIFTALMHSWKHRDCKSCSTVCLEILTARSHEMLRYRCPHPDVLRQEFVEKEKGMWIADGPYLRFHAPDCYECGSIVGSFQKEADDAKTRERLAEFFTALSECQFTSAGTRFQVQGQSQSQGKRRNQKEVDGLRAELKFTDTLLYVDLFDGETSATSPDNLKMAVVLLDETEVDSSVRARMSHLGFLISISRLKPQPFRLRFNSVADEPLEP